MNEIPSGTGWWDANTRVSAPVNPGRDAQKHAAAEVAVNQIEDGMIIGLGSGSTAEMALAALARRIDKGLHIKAIPTSRHCAELAMGLRIPLTDFARHPVIDVTIDGADQVARQGLALIKGRGGALLREKIVASASRRMLVIVDESKLADRLGGDVKLPVEVARFGREITAWHLTNAGCVGELRTVGGRPMLTDNGNNIIDCQIAPMDNPWELEAKLTAIVGVIGCGIFCDLASAVIVGRDDGVEVLTP